jgi:DNA-binding LacI/PurR family transcriptional regulator
MARITTIQQPSFDLGARTAEIFIEHLEKKTKLPAALRLEPRLVVRDSVAGAQEE